MTSTPEINAARLAELGLAQAAPAKTAGRELGQAEFFDLMLAQLKFQDPLKPQENTEFVSQMAQFAGVESLGSIQRSLTELVGALQSNQALQASTLVGRDVLVPGSEGRLGDDGALGGALELPATAAGVRVSVLDARGVLVRQIELGSQPAGRAHFTWDGEMADGTRAEPGRYAFVAEGQVGAQPVALETLMRTRVESVTLRQAPPGATLNLAGVGAVDMSTVRELL